MSTGRASTLSDEGALTAPVGRVPLSVPRLGGNEWTYLKECLDTGWVSSAGPFVERFERALAMATGARHVVAVASGTAALHTALRVVGVAADDEVLVSDLTFVAPVNAIRYCGAHPVLVDAGQVTWQMDVGLLQRFLQGGCELRAEGCYNRRTGRRVRAILPVHLLGLACPMERIMELARQYQLKVVEDAAEAMGVRARGRHAGTFGDIGVLSFNGNKIITAGGGGALLTDHAPSATYARYLTTQAKDDPLEYVHHEIGYNYRISNLQAAVGLAQLEQLEGFISKKRDIAEVYAARLSGCRGLDLMPSLPQIDATFWLYTVLLRRGTTVEERTRVIKRLRALGIESRPLWRPIHLLRPYQGCEVVGGGQAESLYARGISLPSSVGLSLREAEWCAEGLLKSVTDE